MTNPCVAVITANLGGFEREYNTIAVQNPGGMPVHIHRFDDSNFPIRHCAMTPRLQARIPKTFGWEMCPGYEFYMWVDGSCSLGPDAVSYFRDCMGTDDIVFIPHPDRHSIREEAEYIRSRIESGNRYLTTRYEHELIDQQLDATINRHPYYVDDTLYATTAFMYRNTPQIQYLLSQWWLHISRYHIVDQLSIPFLVRQLGINVAYAHINLYSNPYVIYTSHNRHDGRPYPPQPPASVSVKGVV